MVQTWNNARRERKLTMTHAIAINQFSPVRARCFTLLNKKAKATARQVKSVPVVTPTVKDLQDAQAEEARMLAAEVRLAQGGDSAAMTRLIETNRTWIRGIAYSALSDAHLAEDA